MTDLVPTPSKPLPNQRREQFCLHLLEGKSADEAYRLAGFKDNRGNASRLKSNDIIQARLQYLQAQVAEKVEQETHLSRAEVLKLDSDQASLDPLEVLSFSSRGVVVKDLESVPVEIRRCISSVTDTKDGVSIKFHNRHPSIERLAKFHGIVGPAALKQIEEQISPDEAYQHSLQAAAWLEEFSMKHRLATVEEVVELLRTKHE